MVDKDDIKEFNELLKQNRDLVATTAKFNEQIAKSIQQQKNFTEELAKKQEEWDQAKISNAEKYVQTIELTAAASRKNLDTNKDALSALGAMNLQIEQRIEKMRFENTITQKILEDSQKQIKINNEQIKKLEAQEESLKKQALYEQKKQKAARGSAEMFDKAVGSLGMSSEFSKTMLSDMIQTFGSAQGIATTFTTIGKKLTAFIHPANIFANLMEKVVTGSINLAKNIDKVFADFNRATGAGSDYNSMINDLRDDNYLYGIGLERSSAALEAAVSNIRDFTNFSPEMQKEMATSIAMFERLNISTSTSAKLMNDLTNAFSMSGREAIRTVKRVAALATQLGIPPQQMVEEYQQALPSLVKFGDAAEKIFINLAAQAKSMGLGTNELLKFTESLETYTSAAEKAGKINAVFGTTINEQVLLTLEGGEKVDYLREQFARAGVEWDNITNRYRREGLAEMLGVDALTAAKMLSTTTQELEAAKEASMGTAAAVAGLSEKILAATSIQEKWSIAQEAFGQLAVPILEYLTKVVHWILKLNDATDNKLIPTLLTLSGVFAGLMLFLGPLKFALTGIKIAMGAIAAVTGLAGKALMLFMGKALLALGIFLSVAAAAVGLYDAIMGTNHLENLYNSAKSFIVGTPEKADPEIIEENQKIGNFNDSLGETAMAYEEQSVQNQTNYQQQNVKNQTNYQQQIAQGNSNNINDTKKEVVLNLDGRVLGRAIVDMFNDEMSISKIGGV